MGRYSRRQFLKIIGVSTAAGAAWKLGLNFRSLDLIKISESRVLMGTVINLTVIGMDKNEAKTAVTAALNHMAELETILSRHQPNSELSRLNRNGYLNNASQPLLEIIAQSMQISDISDGAFDITIKPVVDLYQDYKNHDALPPESIVAQTLPLVGYHNIRLNGQTISFTKQGMGITLDGIGKGYIVDAGTTVLRKNGFTNVMIEAGGDLMASGEKETAQPWKIGIHSPRPEAGLILAMFNLNNQAAATSGDYMQSFTADLSQHHILDPRTGYSGPELASVTITAPTAMLADGLATAVMVLGSEKGLKLANRLSSVQAYTISKRMEIQKTVGLQRIVSRRGQS